MSKETIPTPEEMAEINKERTLSDAELIKDGAEYRSNKEGKAFLDLTEEQKLNAYNEIKNELKASLEGSIKQFDELVVLYGGEVDNLPPQAAKMKQELLDELEALNN